MAPPLELSTVRYAIAALVLLALAVAPPLELSTVRYAIAALVLLALAALTRSPLPLRRP